MHLQQWAISTSRVDQVQILTEIVLYWKNGSFLEGLQTQTSHGKIWKQRTYKFYRGILSFKENLYNRALRDVSVTLASYSLSY
jgi:hypothetical protein